MRNNIWLFLLLFVCWNYRPALNFSQSCRPPYRCLPPAVCVAQHAPFGGISEMLFKCTSSGSKLCCPAVNTSATPQINEFPVIAEITPTLPSPIPLKTEEPTDLTTHRNANLLPTGNCGYILGDRISGGQNATYGEYPWMALIVYTDSRGKKRPYCGGTLISDYYVLTAAHCLTWKGAQNGVRLTHVTLGEFDLSRDIDCQQKGCRPAVDIPVKKIIPHENYNEAQIKNDIALLRLSYKPEARSNIFPICLPLNVTALNITEEYKYEATGWGLLNFKDTEPSAVLQRVFLYGTKCTFCDNVFQPPPICPIWDKQFCTQVTRKKDVCKGDSGGPLTTTNASTLTFQLGITSFKSTEVCGEEGVPSVYTKVSSYMKWILDNMEP